MMTVFEPNETFAVALGDLPAGVVAGPRSSVTVTITSEDPAPPPPLPTVQFTVSELTVAENASDNRVFVTLELSQAFQSNSLVHFMTRDGTATEASGDYIRAPSGSSVTFFSGVTMREFFVRITNDNLVEEDETFTIELDTARLTGVRAGPRSSVTVTIVSEDVVVLPTVQFSVATATVAEDAGTVDLTLNLREARAEAFTISGVASVTGSSAVGGDSSADDCGCDFSSSLQNVTFAENAVTATISIPIVDDSLVEDNEVFIVSLRDSVLRDENLMVGARGLVRVTITDNDEGQVVGFSESRVTVAENVSGGTVDLTLNLREAPEEEINIPIMTTDVTATAGTGNDYTALAANAMVTFAIGEMSKVVSIGILDDIAIEANETFTVSLGTLPDGITAGIRTSVTVTITSEDGPMLELVSGDVTVVAGERFPVMFRSINGVVSNDLILVSPTTSGSTASFRGNNEYRYLDSDGNALPRNSALTLPGGQDTWTFMMLAVLDADMQRETTNMRIQVNLNGRFLTRLNFRLTIDPAGTVTLPTVQFTAATLSATEGTDSTVTVTVELSEAAAGEIIVPIMTMNGTATSGAGNDYTALMENVTFAPGDTSKDIDITILDDDTLEIEETFTVAFGTLPDGVTAGTQTSVEVTITSEDLPMLELTAPTGNVTVTAGESFPITLRSTNGAPLVDLIFTIGLSDRTPAFRGSNELNIFDPSGNSVGLFNNILQAGREEWTYMVMAILDGDSIVDGITIEIRGSGGFVFPRQSFRLTINPPPPALSVAASPITITEGAASTITITASAAPVGNLTIPYTIAGTNIATGDYTLTDAGGTEITGLTGDITLAASTASVALTLTAADDADTDPEMLTFTLGAGTGYTVTTGTATITINPPPALSVAAAPTTIGEGAASTITITASTAPSGNLTIPYTIAGTGIAAGDYTLTDAGGTEITGLTGDITLPTSAASVALTLTAADDSDASAEMLTFTLGTGTGYTVATATATITIDPASAPLPALSVAASPTTITEGAASTVTITASPAPADDLTIAYTIAGSGIAVGDYTLADASGTELTGLTGNITLAGSAASVALTLTAADDSDASAEMLTFTLGAGTGYTVATATATITIDPVVPLTVSFFDAEWDVGENEGTVDLIVTLSGVTTRDIVIPLVSTDGSAMAGIHYTAVTSVTINRGSDGAIVTVSILDDNVDNTDRMFTVSLGTPLPSGIMAGAVTGTTVNIIDDDAPAPALSVAAVPDTIQEGITSTITITASSAPSRNLTIPFTIAGDNITTDDYTLTAGATALTELTGSVTLADGQNSVVLTLTAVNDADTDSEMLTFTLNPPVSDAGYTLTTSTETITIEPAAAVPTVQFSDARRRVAENVSGGTVTVTVELSGAAAGELIVPIMTTDGSATAGAGNDYTALMENVTFAIGDTSKDIDITILNDDTLEPEEAFTVSLGTLPDGVTAGTPNSVTVTIVSEEVVTVEFAESEVTVAENEGPAEVTLRLSEAAVSVLFIPVGTTLSTARTMDFTLLNQFSPSDSVRFAIGDTEQIVSIEINNDDLVEEDEMFMVFLGNNLPSGAVAGTQARVTVIITDDDSPAVPTVQFSAATLSVAENGDAGVVDVTIQLSEALAEDIDVPLMTMDGSATAGEDYLALTNTMVTISSGSMGRTVGIVITNDDMFEEDETFTVSFGTLPDGVTAGTQTSVEVTIVSEDAAPELVITSETSTTLNNVGNNIEANENVGTIMITLGLSRPVLAADGMVAIELFLLDSSSATRDDDFMLPMTVPFAVGDQTQTAELMIVDDDDTENSETISLFARFVGTARGRGAFNFGYTIRDNDGP